MTKVPTQQVVLATVWALAAIQVAGGAEARRVRLDSLDEIIEIRAAVRHTTVIALPADELIADFVAGDTEFWQLKGEANIAYLKPQARGEKTNVALVTRSGNIYSFLCREGDGKPSLVEYELTADGLYVAQRVLRDGWLQIGKQRADWVYLPAKGLL